MSFNHGSVAKIRLNSVDYSAYLNEGSITFDEDTAETSALGTTAKTYVVGLTDGKFSLQGMFDPTVDAALYGFKGNNAVPFDYRPAGDSTGNVKYTGNCIMTSYEVSASVSNMAAIKANFQITGAVTRTVL